MPSSISRPILLCVLSAVCCLLPAPVYAQVPQLVRYQGTLVDSNNVPLEGSYTLTFRIYDAASDGNVLWTESQAAVPVSRGVFNVLLGQVTSLTLAFDKDCWLTTQVGTDTEMTPRQRLTSVPYAYRAQVAEALKDAAQLLPSNLLKNGDFESWSRGTSAVPDFWNGSPIGSVAKDTTTVKHGSASILFSNTGGQPSWLYQQPIPVSAFSQNSWVMARAFTFSCWVKTSAASRVRAYIYDIANVYSSYHTGSGNWELLTVTKTVGANAGVLEAGLVVDSGPAVSVNADGAMLVGGSIPFAFSPHPQDLTGPVYGKDGNVGIGLENPSAILAIRSGAPTDPIADSWRVYPSDRQHKQITRTEPRGYLAQVKAVPVYEWTRKPLVSDEETRQALEQEHPKRATPPTQKELDAKQQELADAKAKLPKFTAKRVGMAIDDANVPPEVLSVNPDGTKAGIDLLAYIGYLHAALKEAALRLDDLESRLPPAKKP